MSLWSAVTICSATSVSAFSPNPTMMVGGIGKKYVPKWKKKETIGGAGLSNQEKGLVGTVPVLFQQGNVTKSTVALPGQPLSFVASQAGQFIKYGCGKGECGACESMCDGKWIRPCVATVPAMAQGQKLIITVKEIKAQTTSSGKFYSIRSFFMGFWNNLLGMIGFVKARRDSRKNWDERQEYEYLIRRLTMQKRAARLAREEEEKNTKKLYNPRLLP